MTSLQISQYQGVCSTLYSQTVLHPCTNEAQSYLTLVIKSEPMVPHVLFLGYTYTHIYMGCVTHHVSIEKCGRQLFPNTIHHNNTIESTSVILHKTQN